MKVQEKILDKVIDWIITTSAGQLIITKPLGESAMADLVIEKRGKYYNEAKTYLQIRECEKNLSEKVYRAEVSEGEFEPNENILLLFLYFDIVSQDITNIWLIPANVFPKIAKTVFSNDKKVLLFETSIDIEKRNQFSKFLVNKDDLSRVLKGTLSSNT